MIHQDDLQFWLLEHKESKAHDLSLAVLTTRMAHTMDSLKEYFVNLETDNMSSGEALEAMIKLSTDAFILAEKFKD